MDISLTFDRPEEGPGSGPITVGWFLTSDKGGAAGANATFACDFKGIGTPTEYTYTPA